MVQNKEQRSPEARLSVPKDLKDEASIVLDSLGLPINVAVKIFLKQVIEQDGLPFEVKHHRNNLDIAIEQIEKGDYKEYTSTKELFDSLGIEIND